LMIFHQVVFVLYLIDRKVIPLVSYRHATWTQGEHFKGIEGVQY
jgi:hypothetical protein